MRDTPYLEEQLEAGRLQEGNAEANITAMLSARGLSVQAAAARVRGAEHRHHSSERASP